MRNYAVERLLERLALSSYRDNLILKGGTLIAAMVGLDNRSTMDMDATLKGIPLTVENAMKMVGEIIAVPLDDGMHFDIKSACSIMDELDYPGIRLNLDASLDEMHMPVKLDFSTGDVITPKEIAYPFKLLFEDRSISVLSYNPETVLAEKLETILSRGTANTRMRDFYDVFILRETYKSGISRVTVRDAFGKTCHKRGSVALAAESNAIMNEIKDSNTLIALWARYQKKFDYAASVSWEDVILTVRQLLNTILG